MVLLVTRIGTEESSQPPVLSAIMEPLIAHWREQGTPRAGERDGAWPLEPIDALFLHLLLATLPDIDLVVDGIADITQGGSTALWRSHPRRLPTEPLAAHNPATDRSALVVLPIGAASLAGEGTEWGDAVFAIYPLGATGTCQGLAALVARHAPPDSHWRLWLPREQSGFFVTSRLGLVCRRDDGRLEPALTRITRLFDGNFQFLGLIRSVVDEAVLRAQVQRQRATIEELRRDLAATKATLAEITDSLAWSMARRLSGVRGWLAPKGSRRYRLFRRVARQTEGDDRETATKAQFPDELE